MLHQSGTFLLVRKAWDLPGLTDTNLAMKLDQNAHTYPVVKWLTFCFLVIIMLAGCSKGTKTVLDQSEGFALDLPAGYVLDETLNPNTQNTSTWFRKDSQALLAVDIQPLAGARHEKLLQLGKRGYLEHLATELETDLSTHLKVFKDFEFHVIDLGEQPTLEATFETDHDGVPQRAYLLLGVSASEPPNEIMVDYRLPEQESKEDQVWAILLKSVRWVKAEPTPTASPTGTPSGSPTPAGTATPSSGPAKTADANEH